MKCTNCGFDAENSSKCPICGTILTARQEPASQPFEQNPYAQQAPAPQPIEQNPYAQQAPAPQPFEQNPYSQQAPAPQPFEQNPYPQQAPVPQPFEQNPYPQQAPSYPSPQPSVQPAARKKSSTAPIVIGAIMGVVILTGIILCIISSIIYNKGLIESLIEEEYNGNSYYDILTDEEEYLSDDYDLDSKDALEYYSEASYRVGKPFNYAYGSVNLTDVTSEEEKSLKNGILRYTFTIEVTNSSDEIITLVPSEDLDVFDNSADGTENSLFAESLNIDGDEDKIVLAPGKSAVYTVTMLGKELKDASAYITLDLTTESNNSPRTIFVDYSFAGN